MATFTIYNYQFGKIEESMGQSLFPNDQTIIPASESLPKLFQRFSAKGNRLCSKRFHISIHTDEAKRCLTEADKTISEIAYRLGLEYPAHFTRMFKRMFGISPSEYKIRYESYVKADFSSFRLFNAKFLCVLDCILKDFFVYLQHKNKSPLV